MSNPPSKKAENPAHITAFDTVRGLAALSVVFSHYIGSYGWPTKSAAVKQAWTLYPPSYGLGWFCGRLPFLCFKRTGAFHQVFSGYKTPRSFPFSPASISDQSCVSHLAALPVHLPSQLHLSTLGGFFDGDTIPPAIPWLFSTWNASIPFTQLLREGFLLQSGDYFLVPQGWTLPIELGISFLVPVGILLASRHTGCADLLYIVIDRSAWSQLLHFPFCGRHPAGKIL